MKFKIGFVTTFLLAATLAVNGSTLPPADPSFYERFGGLGVTHR